MGFFTLTQNLVERNLYLYPNGDLATCTEFTAVGNNPNYACVDENRLTPNEDTDYVWWNDAALASDLYELPSITEEVNAINYVQVYARGKANDINQEITGEYKIICSPDSVCSIFYESDNIDLVTNYTTYSKVWKTNPSDGSDWEIADVNNLAIGVRCNSPPITGASHTMTLRPNAAGTYTQCKTYGCTNHWECVDETTPDDDTTYIYYDDWNNTKTDTFNVPNHTTEAGTITGITVFVRARDTSDTTAGGISVVVRTGGTNFREAYLTTGTVYDTFSYTWSENPDTGVAWTWNDIDNLEIGAEVYAPYPVPKETRVTQIYAIVNYNDTVAPEIRTTQCYAKINYTTDELICRLNKPSAISTNYARNIKMLNFWDGSREVYDLNRSGKSIILTGSIVDRGQNKSAWCDTDYAFRKKITIDHTQVDGNLANFPVYINTTLDRRCLNDDGYDIMFCDSSCSEYSFEIEDYNPITKGIKAWVKVPTVSSTEDTVFWIYYHKEDVTSDPSTTDVWDDADYRMVQHMTDNPNNTTITGSTDFGHIGTKTGANEPSELNSLLYKAQKFDGIDDDISVPDDVELRFDTPFIVSLWAKIKASSTDPYGILLTKATSYSTKNYNFYWSNYGVITFRIRDVTNGVDRHVEKSGNSTHNIWHHIVGIYDGTNITIYIDGVAGTSTAMVGTPATGATPIKIGRLAYNAGNNDYRFNGDIEEIHIIGTNHGVNWIKAEYANQKENSTFITYGRQQENYVDIINACDTIICVRDMTRNGSIVVINELTPLYFNGNYRIKSFGWKKISEKPEYYNWILELEDTD